MNTIIANLISLWSIPPVIFGTVYGIFASIERVVSVETRSTLAGFLQNHNYEPYLDVLPEAIQTTFFRLFGPRHLSRKCILRSILLSQISLLLTAAISVLWAFQAFSDLATKFATNLVLQQASANPQTKQFADWIAKFGSIKLLLMVLAVWVFWTVIPDYIGLLKIRIVLIILRYTSPKISTLITTGIVDFVVGIFIFLVSFSMIQTVALLVYAVINQKAAIDGLHSIIAVFVLVESLIFGLESALIVPTNAIFITPIIANLFWASMIPSIWLWAYIISSLITRTLTASRPILRLLVRLLDVEQKPIQSIGIIAASVMAAASLVISVVRVLI